MRLSTPLIVKNEAATIEDCLRPLRMLSDELIVLDTGSTDETPEICRKYADRVIFSSRWTKETSAEDFHFADARNDVLAHCTGDWVLSVDADETTQWREPFKQWLADVSARSVYVPMRFVNNMGHVARLPRLFRREGVSWSGRYHDMPYPWDDSAPTADESMILLLNSGGESRDKLFRNLSLLRRQHVESSRICDTTLQLADTYRALGATFYPEAIGYFEITLSAIGKIDDMNKPYILFSLADCYAKLGCIGKALDYATILIREFPRYARGPLVAGWCYDRLKQWDLAICYYERAATMKDPMPLHPMVDEPIDVDAVRNRVMICDSHLREDFRGTVD